MILKKIIDENEDWGHIDYVCIKARANNLHVATYYLDGHLNFEKSLTLYDKDFINFTRHIGVYGTSEKILGENSVSDRIYVRVNISSEYQEVKLIDYLKKEKNFSIEQCQVLNHLRCMKFEFNDKDYRSLYYCGFSKENEDSDYENIRFYFKTFGADESKGYDFEAIKYLEKCPIIEKDATFQLVRNLVLNGWAGLRSVGLDIADNGFIKIKYYLCQGNTNNTVKEWLREIKKYSEYKQTVNMLFSNISDIEDFYCDLMQISGGYDNKEKSINMYLEKETEYKKQYYSIRDGLVLRNVGGVIFLVDIYEKHYYDLKKLLSVNETGQVIIEYLMKNGVCTIDGIVSHLRSLIKNYCAEMYSSIYDDCKRFIKQLQNAGYLQEVQ